MIIFAPPTPSGASATLANILAKGITVIGAGLETFRSSLQSVSNSARSLFSNALDTLKHASTESPIPKNSRIELLGLTTKNASVEGRLGEQPRALIRRLSTEEGRSDALEVLGRELAEKRYECTPKASHTTSNSRQRVRDSFDDPDDSSSDAGSISGDDTSMASNDDEELALRMPACKLPPTVTCDNGGRVSPKQWPAETRLNTFGTPKNLTQIDHAARNDKVLLNCTDLELELPQVASINHETRQNNQSGSIDDLVLTPEEEAEYQQMLAAWLDLPTQPLDSDDEELSFDAPVQFGPSPRIYVASISAPELEDIAEETDGMTTFTLPADASTDLADTVSLDSWLSEPTSSDDERGIALSSRDTAGSDRRMWQTPDRNDLEADLAKLSESYRQQWGSSGADLSAIKSADEAAIDVESASDADEAERIADKFRSALEAAETFDSSVKSLRKTILVPDVEMQWRGQHRLI